MPELDRTQQALNQSIVNLLAPADEAFESDPRVGVIRNRTGQYYNSIAEFEASLEAIRQNRDLSQEGKQKQIQAAREKYEAAYNETLESLEYQTKALERQFGERIRPAPLDENPMLSEAKLQNARADAQMLLASTPPNSLPHRMLELIQGSKDPALKHLLGATSWAETYLEARGAGHHVKQAWESMAERRLMPLLSDEGRAAHQALTNVRKVRKTIEGSHYFFTKDRGL